MSDPKVRLTDAQAETILELISGQWHTFSFGLHQPFTGSDNKSIGARRSLQQLVSKGLIVRDHGVEGMENGRVFPVYQLTGDARNAALDWEMERDMEPES